MIGQEFPKSHHLNMEFLYPRSDKFVKEVTGGEDLGLYLIRVKSNRDRKFAFSRGGYFNRLVEKVSEI